MERIVGLLIPNLYLAGVLVSLVGGIVSLMLLQAWLGVRGLAEDARPAFISVLMFPAGFYLFGVMYAESLFLSLAILAFVLLEKRRPYLAGLIGAMAMLTRPVGLVVAVALILRQSELRGTRRELRRADFGVLLAGGGLIALVVIQWAAVGDPLAFLKEGGSTWGHGLDWWTVLKFQDWTGNVLYRPLAISQLAIAVGALAVVPAVKRRFGWAYAAYVAGVILLPVLVRPTIVGAARYVLVAFPLFAIVGPALRRPGRWGAVANGVSLAFLLRYLSLFAGRFFVG